MESGSEFNYRTKTTIMDKYKQLIEQVRHRIEVLEDFIKEESDGTRKAAYRLVKKDLEEMLKIHGVWEEKAS